MKKERTALHPAHVALAAGMMATVALCATMMGVVGAATGASVEQAQAEPTDSASQHVHSWQQNVELEHHDAITHQVTHDAIMGTALVPHTICNACEDVIDGQTAEHAEATGHLSYTPDVPRPEPYVAQAAWAETVVDQEAYDEVVVRTETCSECDAKRAVPTDA